MGGAASTTASFRAEYRTTKIGRSYSGWGHFAFTNLGSLTVIGFSISRVDHPSWKELLVIPIAFLIANLVEYLGHRGPMHRMKRGLGVIFRRHTLEHHHFFTDQQMSYESSRDFKAGLFPPVMLLFFIGGSTSPVIMTLFLLISPNAGWLFVAVGISYYLTYEWLHFAYHLPEDTAVGRLAVLGVLRRHQSEEHTSEIQARP